MMDKKQVFLMVICLLVGIFIGCHATPLQPTQNTVKTEKQGSQIQFYDDIVTDINTIEMYDSKDLTLEKLKNRNGKIIIEKIIGQVTTDELDGKILNPSSYNEGYISYKRVEGVRKNDKVLTYYIYNPFTNEVDDVLTRLDFVIDDNSI